MYTQSNIIIYSSLNCPTHGTVYQNPLRIVYRVQRFIISFKCTIHNTIVYPVWGWPNLDHCPTPGFVSCPAFLFTTFRLIFHLTVLYFFIFILLTHCSCWRASMSYVYRGWLQPRKQFSFIDDKDVLILVLKVFRDWLCTASSHFVSKSFVNYIKYI